MPEQEEIRFDSQSVALIIMCFLVVYLVLSLNSTYVVTEDGEFTLMECLMQNDNCNG